MSIDQPVKKDRTWLYVGLGFVFVWTAGVVIIGSNGGAGSAPPELTPPANAPAASFDWSLETLDGKAVSLADYKGKPIVLNRWATWCGPCVGEMPSLVSLAAKTKDAGAVVVCVTDESSTAKVKTYADANMKGLIVLRAVGPAPPLYDSDAIPATFVIDPAGRVVLAQVGSAEWDHPAVVKFVEKLGKPTKS